MQIRTSSKRRLQTVRAPLTRVLGSYKTHKISKVVHETGSHALEHVHSKDIRKVTLRALKKLEKKKTTKIKVVLEKKKKKVTKRKKKEEKTTKLKQKKITKKPVHKGRKGIHHKYPAHRKSSRRTTTPKKVPKHKRGKYHMKQKSYPNKHVKHVLKNKVRKSKVKHISVRSHKKHVKKSNLS